MTSFLRRLGDALLHGAFWVVDLLSSFGALGVFLFLFAAYAAVVHWAEVSCRRQHGTFFYGSGGYGCLYQTPAP